uniref:Macrophage migration inhibitory factor homolog n=1 Tax=Solanum lycopersicum TaxID=4081 RepID=A0A3Q7IIS3_SOLLC
MPCLNISTNVNLEGVDTSSVLSEATSTVAKLIGKPEAYVMIVLKGSVPMAFGGTEQPAAYGELVSIGGLNADVNKKLSAAIADILETKLSIPKSRFFLKFYDTKVCPSKSRICTMSSCYTPVLDHGSFFGWNGSTF